MIVASCPYCQLVLLVPVELGKAEHMTCEECRNQWWLVHSNVDPQSFTIEEFEAKFDVDPATKMVRRKKP